MTIPVFFFLTYYSLENGKKKVTRCEIKVLLIRPWRIRWISESGRLLWCACSLCNAAVFRDASLTVPVVTSRCLQTPWNLCERTDLETVILGLGSGYCWPLSVIFLFYLVLCLLNPGDQKIEKFMSLKSFWHFIVFFCSIENQCICLSLFTFYIEIMREKQLWILHHSYRIFRNSCSFVFIFFSN